jgi:hypothetical protein
MCWRRDIGDRPASAAMALSVPGGWSKSERVEVRNLGPNTTHTANVASLVMAMVYWNFTKKGK